MRIIHILTRIMAVIFAFAVLVLGIAFMFSAPGLVKIIWHDNWIGKFLWGWAMIVTAVEALFK